MKIIRYVFRFSLLACLFACCTEDSHSQVEDLVELTLHTRSVPVNPDALRLLPREHELRDGNAAIELLRMPWEQTNFMELSRKRMNDWLEMEGDDPELIKYEYAFEVFKKKMQRAAYTRDADWDYPLDEQPFVTVLLPDVQGMREFAGRVMSLWVRVQITKGNLRGAQEGILIQLACARHVSRTQITVCQLVGVAIASIGLTEFEDLIQHPDSANFYYALSMLPDSLGDFNSAVDLEANIIRNSMPSLAKGPLPPAGSDKWKEAFNELFEYYISSITSTENIDREALKRQCRIARQDLSALCGLSKSQIEKMSDEEIAARWLLAHSERLSARYIAAIQLPKDQAIQKLVELEQEADKLNEKVAFEHIGEVPPGAVVNQFFDMFSVRSFTACHRLGRKAKLLQIVEALRHHASQNENRLPKSLEEVELHLPVDPFTNKPAEYELKEGVATLRWPLIPNLKERQNYRRSYQLKMSAPN